MPIKYGKTEKRIDRQTKKVNIVHDYMKCKSNSDEAFSYAESETPKEYTLASPIFNPVGKDVEPLLL